MLAHTEVIIGAPHGDFTRATKTVARSAREGASLALQVRKYPAQSLEMQVLELPTEIIRNSLAAFRVIEIAIEFLIVRMAKGRAESYHRPTDDWWEYVPISAHHRRLRNSL